MVKEFNSLEEIQQYYDEESNTYVFKENNKFIDIVKEFGEPAKAPAFEGNNMVVIIDPKK